MPSLSLNSNIASLSVQNRLESSTRALSSNFQRLSSGLRINKASDDAAGLALASALQCDTRVFTQAVRNLNDGISYLSVASAALEQLSNILVRARELSTQGANGTVSPSQRAALDEEAQALSEEYNRILAATEYNGANVFSSSVSVQSGYTAEDLMNIGFETAAEEAPAEGTMEFAAAASFEGGNTFYNIRAADLNNDGKADIIASSGSGLVTALGTGNGSFAAPQNVLTGTGSMNLGYFNADSYLDVAFTTGQSGCDVGVALGNGDGTFQEAVTYATSGVFAGTPLIGDFDEDGKVDIATALWGGPLELFTGNGDGTFDSAISHTISWNTETAVTGDFNNDGHIDVAGTSQNSQTLDVLLGTGAGSFTRSVYTVEDGPAGITAGDLNNDGADDLIVMKDGNSYFSVHMSGGESHTDISNSTPNGSPSLGDFDDDGNLDLLTIGNWAEDSNIMLRLGNGDGTFKEATSLGLSGYSAIFGPADLNNDGVTDFIAAASHVNIVPWLQETSGTTPAAPAIALNNLTGINLRTQESAEAAQTTIDSYMEEVESAVAVIGAQSSRLEFSINNLQNRAENTAVAVSRIMDVDVATEAAEFARNRILQSAGVSTLKLANLQPQMILRLLDDTKW